MKVYKEIARCISALNGGCTKQEILDYWENKLAKLNCELPIGSGFDSGCNVILDESRTDKIVISADYHHINDHGYYMGWTHHKVIITPSLSYDFDLRITGPNKRFIKDYIVNTFQYILDKEYTE